MAEDNSFEIAEIVDVDKSGFDFKTISILNEHSQHIEITTTATEFIFGNIRITPGIDEGTLLIEDLSLKGKALDNKILTMASGEKGKEGGPAGSPVPPKVIVRPKP